MEGRLLQPVGIQLLGLDFLEANGRKINLGIQTLELNGGGKIFDKIICNGAEGYHVSRVTVRKRVTASPMSIKFVWTSFHNPAEVDLNIEPNQESLETVLPCFVKGSDFSRLCVDNLKTPSC